MRVLVGTVLTMLPVVAAGSTCIVEQIFDTAFAQVGCTLDGSEIEISLPFADSYLDESDAADMATKRTALAQARGVVVVVQSHNGAVQLVVDPRDVTPTQVTLRFGHDQVSDLSAVRAVTVRFPPGSLYCGDEPNSEKTSVLLQEPTVLDCVQLSGAAWTRSWDLELGEADTDDDGKAGVTGQWWYEQEKRFSVKVHPTEDLWSGRAVKLRLEGAAATNDSDFYDSLKGEAMLSYLRSAIGEQARSRAIPVWWAGAYLRPEATVNGDSLDYVYGARLEAMANLENLIGFDLGAGARPYIAVGYERVDPSRREDGGIPENYDRLAGRLKWRFKPHPAVVFDADWEVYYLLDDDDLDAAGFDDTISDRLDLTLSLELQEGAAFRPFITYTRGETGPEFEYVQEVLIGFLWQRLAKDTG